MAAKRDAVAEIMRMKQVRSLLYVSLALCLAIRSGSVSVAPSNVTRDGDIGQSTPSYNLIPLLTSTSSLSVTESGRGSESGRSSGRDTRS